MKFLKIHPRHFYVDSCYPKFEKCFAFCSNSGKCRFKDKKSLLELLSCTLLDLFRSTLLDLFDSQRKK